MTAFDIPRAGRSLATSFVIAALAACGGDSDGGPAAAPLLNAAPVASFTAPATVDAGKPLPLDARTSSDADGDALTYTWSFGDGGIGGGERIAHVFSAGGSFTVRLTVHDGKGGSHFTEKSVAVTAAPAPLAVVDTLAVVRGIDGPTLADVTVTLVGGSTVANTDALGRARLRTGTGVPQLLRFSKAGFSDQFRDATLPASAESGYVEVTLQPRQAPLTLANASAGGTLTGQYGAKVTFPAAALVDAAGNPVAGPVSVSMTPVDVAANVRAFPGRFEGVRVDGSEGLLLSYGTVEYALSVGAVPVQLAPGAKAMIEIPIFASLHRDGTPMKAGDTSPLWSLDENSGGWIEEGSGTVVVADTPSGFALRAEVQHFSWWNHDQFDFPPARPKPKCLIDTNLDGVFEDLTGTGYCWHGGTGPEQGGAGNAQPQRLAARPGATAVEPRTVRLPTYAAFTSTPAAGGVVLPIPADMDIRFRSYAKNGSLFGTRIVRLGPGVEQEVLIELTPVQLNDGTRAIALPYTDQFRMDYRGETDRFTFAGTAGESYLVSIASLTPDGLTGTVRVTGPGNAPLVNGDFAANGFTGTAAATVAGTITVEVGGQGNAPGGYRIEVRKDAASNCANPGVLALPETRATVGLAADSVTCFNLNLVADDVIDIQSTNSQNAQGTATLLAPNGDRVGSDTFGSAATGNILLRAAVAQAGTWRLEIFNTRNTAGSISNLSLARLPVTSTLAVPGSAAVAAPPPDGIGQSFFYVVKPVPGAREFTAALDAKGISQRLRSYPDGLAALSTVQTARVVVVHPALNGLLEVTQTNAKNAIDFAVTTGVPDTLTLDADVALTASAPGLVKVYRLDGSPFQQFTIGRQIPVGSTATPTVRIYSPGTGAQIVPTNENLIHTLSGTGVHTVEVTNGSGAGATGPFTIRVNNARPVEPITLAALTERSATLALGEVQRYSMTVTQAQVMSLSLASPGALDVTANLVGGNIFEGRVFLPATDPDRAVRSKALYAQVAGSVELTAYAPARIVGNVATTSFTVGLRAPVPAPTALGTLVEADLPAGGLLSYGYTIAAAGEHLLCYRYTGPVDNLGLSRVDARVWGPSAPFTNYGGDINGQGNGNRVEVIGALRAGANTLSVTHNLDVVTPVGARLIAVGAPSPITVGAAPTAGTLTPCERRYHAFDALVAQTYSVRVTANFAGAVRVRKLVAPGFHSVRVDPPAVGNLGGSPLSLTANVERVVSFTISAGAPFGSGVYIVEVDADDDAAGTYSVSIGAP